MITWIRLVKQLEFGIFPVKLSGVNHNAADTGPVSTHPFGNGVDHNVCTVFNCPEKIGRGERSIDDEWQVVVVSDICYRGNVGKIENRISDGFDENGTGFIRYGEFKIPGLMRIDKLGFDSELRKNTVEHSVRSSI